MEFEDENRIVVVDLENQKEAIEWIHFLKDYVVREEQRPKTEQELLASY